MSDSLAQEQKQQRTTCCLPAHVVEAEVLVCHGPVRRCWLFCWCLSSGCDKNMPGCLIAMARLNRPSLMVYGGTIRAGCSTNHDKLDIVSAFQVSE